MLALAEQRRHLVRILDFNDVRFLDERVSKGVYNHDGPEEFIKDTNGAMLLEIPSIGGQFTWTNKETEDLFI